MARRADEGRGSRKDETNRPAGDCPIAFAAISALGFGAVAQPLLAEPALTAANGERHDDPVPYLEVRDLGSEVDHFAHVLVAEDVAALHGGLVAVEEMKVGPADRARRDLDDGIPRMLDLRIRNRVHSNVAFSVPA